MSRQLFETNASATLDRVEAIFSERGEGYGDTWKDCQFLTLKAVAEKLGASIPDDAWRAIACAAFSDMKYQRLQGGYKDDNLFDGIAYSAYLAKEVENVLKGRGVP